MRGKGTKLISLKRSKLSERDKLASRYLHSSNSLDKVLGETIYQNNLLNDINTTNKKELIEERLQKCINEWQELTQGKENQEQVKKKLLRFSKAMLDLNQKEEISISTIRSLLTLNEGSLAYYKYTSKKEKEKHEQTIKQSKYLSQIKEEKSKTPVIILPSYQWDIESSHDQKLSDSSLASYHANNDIIIVSKEKATLKTLLHEHIHSLQPPVPRKNFQEGDIVISTIEGCTELLTKKRLQSIGEEIDFSGYELQLTFFECLQRFKNDDNLIENLIQKEGEEIIQIIAEDLFAGKTSPRKRYVSFLQQYENWCVKYAQKNNFKKYERIPDELLDIAFKEIYNWIKEFKEK